MAGFNISGFPLFIRIRLGSRFGASGAFWGLGAGDYVVFRRSGLTSLIARYTETGNADPSNISVSPTAPTNRLRLTYRQTGNSYIDEIEAMVDDAYPVCEWGALNTSDADAQAAGWAGGTLGAEGTDTMDGTSAADRVLMTVFNNKAQAGNIYNSEYISNLNSYPKKEITFENIKTNRYGNDFVYC